MTEEYNIFILWSTARNKEADLIDKIAESFDVVRTYEVSWSPKSFIANLSRFYGKKLPSARSKLKICGKDSFLVLLVKDNKPDIMENGKNANMLSVKYELRKMLGYNYLHASDNEQEARENLYFLLGKSIEELLQTGSSNKIYKWKQDLIGTPTWLDEDKLKKAIKYLPNSKYDEKAKVIFCEDVMFAKRILNARKVWYSFKPMYKINLRGNDVIFRIEKI